MRKANMRKIMAILGISMICNFGSGNDVYASSVKFYNGHRYQACNSTMKWNDARVKCARRGGHLVTITSSGEQKFVEKLISGQKRNIFWIGLYKSGYTNRWVTGERVSYLNIELNQRGQNYYGMYANKATESWQKWKKGMWYDHDDILRNDYWDYTRTGYICEWDTTPMSYATATLKKTIYYYDGTAKKPEITVKVGNTILKKGRDYTVKYSSNRDIGTAKVIISGKGSYTGTITKKFTIRQGNSEMN